MLSCITVTIHGPVYIQAPSPFYQYMQFSIQVVYIHMYYHRRIHAKALRSTQNRRNHIFANDKV